MQLDRLGRWVWQVIVVLTGFLVLVGLLGLLGLLVWLALQVHWDRPGLPG